MMLPRLHLAHTLLSDDGVIFISIDDNEQAQLKLLCDEVFGERILLPLFQDKHQLKDLHKKNIFLLRMTIYWFMLKIKIMILTL